MRKGERGGGERGKRVFLESYVYNNTHENNHTDTYTSMKKQLTLNLKSAESSFLSLDLKQHGKVVFFLFSFFFFFFFLFSFFFFLFLFIFSLIFFFIFYIFYFVVECEQNLTFSKRIQTIIKFWFNCMGFQARNGSIIIFEHFSKFFNGNLPTIIDNFHL